MTTALAYEWVRLRSLRITWWLTGGSVLVTALAAWGYSGVVLGVRSDGDPVDGAEAVVLVVARPSMAPLVAGILGIFAVANEYRYGTMRTTVLVTPQRTVALAAKAAVIGGFGAGLALANLAVAWLIGVLTLAGSVSLSLSAVDALQLHLAQILLVVGWSLIGVAVATLVRSQAFALAVLLAVPFAVEPAIRSVGAVSGQTWLAKAAGLLPFSAGNAMTDISHGASSTLLAPAASRVSPMAGGTVFLCAVGILSLVALAQFRRQDV